MALLGASPLSILAQNHHYSRKPVLAELCFNGTLNNSLENGRISLTAKKQSVKDDDDIRIDRNTCILYTHG